MEGKVQQIKGAEVEGEMSSQRFAGLVLFPFYSGQALRAINNHTASLPATVANL